MPKVRALYFDEPNALDLDVPVIAVDFSIVSWAREGPEPHQRQTNDALKIPSFTAGFRTSSGWFLFVVLQSRRKCGNKRFGAREEQGASAVRMSPWIRNWELNSATLELMPASAMAFSSKLMGWPSASRCNETSPNYGTKFGGCGAVREIPYPARLHADEGFCVVQMQ